MEWVGGLPEMFKASGCVLGVGAPFCVEHWGKKKAIMAEAWQANRKQRQMNRCEGSRSLDAADPMKAVVFCL